jgi:hypothetical protein
VWLAEDPVGVDAVPLDDFEDPPQPEAAIEVVASATATNLTWFIVLLPVV